LSDEPDAPRNASVEAMRAKIQAKIGRIVDQIKVEQQAKEDNVNEYLRLSAMDDSVTTDRQQAHRVKAAFEKRNQKSTQVIAQLQRKLEMYTRRMHELETHGIVYSSGVGGRQGQRPARTVLKDVGHGIKTMVSKPKEFAHLIRNKFGSADHINVSTLEGLDESHCLKVDAVQEPRKGSGTLPSDFKYHSEENVSVVVSEPSPPISSGLLQQNSPLLAPSVVPQQQPQSHHQQQQPQLPSQMEDQRSQLSDHNSMSILLKQLERSREIQNELQDAISDLQSHIEESQAFFRQALDEERLRSEHLEEQLNDMMELQQNEVTNIKQELSSLEEKMEYQLEERTRDMQDMLESCQTKITKMELQQQQQQLISMEGFDGSAVRVLLSKLINVVLALLAVLLVFIHTGIHLLGPLNTRLRCIVTAVAVTIGAIVWQNRQILHDYATSLLLTSDKQGGTV
jgi:hypothetical protein